ncbi:MAG: dTDP-4-dehydrorhamnose reductase [Proteobacteria bacterium]|nr:MAG: dTDP-4-dehydrorhamnose reductase [Pseudomonadota bacterium]PIE39876.1 MAG: dTDP-4-dehydrorhamnose reductase [Gammaproteobacteria bacterium]
MIILVVGATGQLGSELVQSGALEPHTVLQAVRSEAGEVKALDVTDPEALAAFFCAHKIDLVINATGYTAVDRAESDHEGAFLLNAQAVANLADVCAQHDCVLIHFSTDYVFDGKQKTPYVESSPTCPVSVYGQSKLAGERLLAERLDKFIILRVSWLFGANGHNFVKTMLKLAKTGNVVRVVNDQKGAPTGVRSVASAVARIICHDSFGKDSFPWGVYHLPSLPAVTWFQFAGVVFDQALELELLPKAVKVVPISSEDYPTPVKRPENSVLASELIADAFGIAPSCWKTDLRGMLQALKVQNQHVKN